MCKSFSFVSYQLTFAEHKDNKAALMMMQIDQYWKAYQLKFESHDLNTVVVFVTGSVVKIYAISHRRCLHNYVHVIFLMINCVHWQF